MTTLTPRQAENLISEVDTHLPMCAIQAQDGWYVDDCLKRGFGVRKQCWRCQLITRLRKALA